MCYKNRSDTINVQDYKEAYSMQGTIQKLKWLCYTLFSGLLIYGARHSFLQLVAVLAILYLNFFYVFFRKEMQVKVKQKCEGMPELSEEKAERYEEAGLSQQDIQFFRGKMNHVKQQIQQIESIAAQNGKIQAILNRYNTLEMMKNYFQQIVRYPQRLHEANQFVNTLLPSLREISGKYDEISQHITKTAATYQVLEETAALLEQMCQQIEEDYLQFTKRDFEALEIETQYLQKQTSTVEQFEDF